MTGALEMVADRMEQICIVENGGNVLCYGFDENLMHDLAVYLNEPSADGQNEYDVQHIKMYADRRDTPTAFEWLVNMALINKFYSYHLDRAKERGDKGASDSTV